MNCHRNSLKCKLKTQRIPRQLLHNLRRMVFHLNRKKSIISFLYQHKENLPSFKLTPKLTKIPLKNDNQPGFKDLCTLKKGTNSIYIIRNISQKIKLTTRQKKKNNINGYKR